MAERNTNYLLHRDEVLERYGGKCANCGSSGDLEIHHIVPVALGGTDNITNLVPLCYPCHRSAHLGRSIDDIKEQRGTAKRGGRKPKISFKEFDKAFDMYVGGEIGKTMFCKLARCDKRVIRSEHYPHYGAAMEKRGIVRFRNNIDTMCVNSGLPSLRDGTIVGYIEYADGRREDMVYHDTGKNKVHYFVRGCGRGSNGCVEIENKKDDKNICDGQLNLFDVAAML